MFSFIRPKTKPVKFFPFRLVATTIDGKKDVYSEDIFSERQLKDNMKRIKSFWTNKEVTIKRISI